MALLKVIPYGDPLLRRQSERIDEIDDGVRRLISDMTDTMRVANGVGLAAPQVGVLRMLFLIDWEQIDKENGQATGYINPEIMEFSGNRATQEEGCLSLPEVSGDVQRPEAVRIRYVTVDGKTVEEELSGLPARVYQHEYDHLQGILFIDRISVVARKKLRDGLQAIMDGRVIPFDGSEEMMVRLQREQAAV